MTRTDPPPVDLTDTFVRTEDHLEADLGDENVILSVDEGEYYGMSGVGPVIWELLEEPQTGTQLVEDLLDQYEVDPEQVRRDVEAFLGELEDEGLVEVVDEA